MEKSNVKYLALKGGGSKVYGHVGGILGLDEVGVYNQIEGFSGTSAGSIIAGLCAIGYTPKEVKEIVFSYDLKKFEDKTFMSVLKSPFTMGICSGNYFLSVIKKAIKDKTGNENYTFADLKKDGKKQLKVYATAVDRVNVLQEFSSEITPNVRIADAIRASMSIPAIYQPFSIEGQLYFDGGIALNYPINVFDEEEKTIGIFFYDSKDYRNNTTNKLNYSQPFKATIQLFKAGLDSQDINTLSNDEVMRRTIKIDTLGISSTDFGINKSQQLALLESGKRSAIYFF
jgi:NTE family protein